MKRLALALALVLTACGDSPTPPAPPGEEDLPLGGETAALMAVVTISPSTGHLDLLRRMRFTASVQTSDTAWTDVTWSVMDTSVAGVVSLDSVTAQLTSRKAGFTLLLARWKAAVAAVAIIVEDVVVRRRSSHMTQGVAGASHYVAGKPVFVQAIVTADTANDWIPAAVVTEGFPFPWDTLYSIPMEVPDSGIPVSLQWDDFELVDSTFHAIIPGDSVRADPRGLHVSWDWNSRDGDGPWGHIATVVEPPSFHLVIVPVIWDSVPDYRIMEWTKGLTADSFRIHRVRELLPVPFGYPVTVAADSFVTKQNLTTLNGWGAFLNEIDSIRKTDTTRAYYYGAIAQPEGSRIAGIAYVGYPTSVGTLGVIDHEIGHNMNLWHAPCGGAGGPDPNYPYEGGKTGQWGFGFRDRRFRNPATHYDVMSYCGPKWISDYHFNRALKYRLYDEDKWWDTTAVLPRPPVVVDSIKPYWPGPEVDRH